MCYIDIDLLLRAICYIIGVYGFAIWYNMIINKKQYTLHTYISATGRLLLTRYVSLTLTGLLSAWRRGEPSLAMLAKSLSAYECVICLGDANKNIWKFVKF